MAEQPANGPLAGVLVNWAAMGCRFESLDVDIASSAGWGSAITGLLAGRTLAAVPRSALAVRLG